jgi:ribosomal silencing factor RsfS
VESRAQVIQVLAVRLEQEAKNNEGNQMKWKERSESHWVLIAPDGEIVDEIRRNDDYFFVLKSTGKKYIDIKKAKNARITATKPT